MKKYTNIPVPLRFSNHKEAYPDFYKPIGIVSQEDYTEASKEVGIKWLVLEPTTDVEVLKNNYSHKIIFFCEGFDNLIKQLRLRGCDTKVVYQDEFGGLG